MSDHFNSGLIFPLNKIEGLIMAKSNVLKKRGNVTLENDLDFRDIFHSHEQDEAMAGFIHGIIEASNNQMTLAVELTKLIVNKSTKDMKEDEVFLILKKASDAVANSTPMKTLWEQLKND